MEQSKPEHHVRHQTSHTAVDLSLARNFVAQVELAVEPDLEALRVLPEA